MHRVWTQQDGHTKLVTERLTDLAFSVQLKSYQRLPSMLTNKRLERDCNQTIYNQTSSIIVSNLVVVTTRVEGLVIEHMQVPVLVNICPVSQKKVLAYVQSLTPLP